MNFHYLKSHNLHRKRSLQHGILLISIIKVALSPRYFFLVIIMNGIVFFTEELDLFIPRELCAMAARLHTLAHDGAQFSFFMVIAQLICNHSCPTSQQVEEE